MTDHRSVAARYERDGIVAPLDVLSADEAGDLLDRLDRFAASAGGWAAAASLLKGKAHLPFPWLTAVVRRPEIVDPVAEILGPDLLCWGSTLWVKPPASDGFVSFHQDARYLGLDPPITCSAWLALTDSSVASGCVEFVPGSHRAGVLDHDERPEAGNLLSVGQHVVGVDVRTAVPIELRPGQASLHHECTVHGSASNRSTGRRVGLNIHYIPPWVRHSGLQGGTALSIRGDAGDAWGADPEPAADPDPAVLSYVASAYAGYEASARGSR